MSTRAYGEFPNHVFLGNLWYENEKGDILPDPLTDIPSLVSVKDYPYACSRFPFMIRTERHKRRDDGAYGSKDLILTTNSGAPEDLVLAMATGANGQEKYSLHDAIVLASEACGGCMNALAHRYGLQWGAAKDSPELANCNTSCVICTE